MSYSHAIRVTLPYADCSGVISMWADRCSKAIVYQHDADEEVSKTHVHIALQGCETKSEALKRMWKDAPGKGNEFWSWKDWDGDVKYISYMSKGTLREVFNKNFSQDLVEKSRQAWVEPTLGNDRTRDDSDALIRRICDMINMSKFVNEHDYCEFGLLLSEVRSVTFRVLWAQHRKVPHASHYKIIAGSVFMRKCEDAGYYEEGANLIRNLWY